MYSTTHETLDMIRDYLDGTLTAADAEAWAELQDLARNILTAEAPDHTPTTSTEAAV